MKAGYKIGLSKEDKQNMANDVYNRADAKITPQLNGMHQTIQGLGGLQPNGVDNASNILSYTYNKGVYVANDTGGWYYWNGSSYVYGGMYQNDINAIDLGTITISSTSYDVAIAIIVGKIKTYVETNSASGRNLIFTCKVNYSSTNLGSWLMIYNGETQETYVNIYNGSENVIYRAYYNASNVVVNEKVTQKNIEIPDGIVTPNKLEVGLKNLIEIDNLELINLTWNIGYVAKNTGIVDADQNQRYTSIEVKNGEVYSLNGCALGNITPYVLKDTKGSIVSTGEFYNSITNYTNLVVNITANGILYINALEPSNYGYTKIKKTNNYKIKLQENNVEFENLTSKIQEAFTKNEIYEDITKTLEWNDGYFWNSSGYLATDGSGRICNIEVNEGEKYRITGYNAFYHRLYMLRDNVNFNDNKNYGMFPDSETINFTPTLYENIEIVIPIGCKYLCLGGFGSTNEFSSYNNYFKLEKMTTKLTANVDGLEFENENIKERIIEEQLKNDFEWKTPNKLYISFIFDDSNSDISDIETLFENKGVPCCFATIPSKLTNITNSGETVKEVLQRAVLNGGEVLSHWGSPLTNSSTDKEYYEVYVGAKKTLINNGFEVNGIITAGGENYDSQDFEKCTKLARIYYQYGDLTSYSNQNVKQFYNMRKFITTEPTTNRGFIDKFISDGQLFYDNNINVPLGKPHWLIFASHGTNDNVTTSILTDLLDYIIAKGTNIVEIVSCKEAFNKGKSSKLEERIKALESK